MPRSGQKNLIVRAQCRFADSCCGYQNRHQKKENPAWAGFSGRSSKRKADSGSSGVPTAVSRTLSSFHPVGCFSTETPQRAPGVVPTVDLKSLFIDALLRRLCRLPSTKSSEASDPLPSRRTDPVRSFPVYPVSAPFKPPLPSGDPDPGLDPGCWVFCFPFPVGFPPLNLEYRLPAGFRLTSETSASACGKPGDIRCLNARDPGTPLWITRVQLIDRLDSFVKLLNYIDLNHLEVHSWCAAETGASN